MNYDGLTITIGAPGSGKSTWADSNLPADTLRLERDRFREALFGSRRAYHDHPMDGELKSGVVTAAMLAAMEIWPTRSWALTDTGVEYRRVQPFIHLAEVFKQPVRLVIFERDADFLLTCNRIRPHAHRVPEDILIQKIEELKAPDGWWNHSPYDKVTV